MERMRYGERRTHLRGGDGESWRAIIRSSCSFSRSLALLLFSLSSSSREQRACTSPAKLRAGEKEHRREREITRRTKAPNRPPSSSPLFFLFLHHAPACCCWPPAAPLLLLLATPRAESEQTSRRRRCAWRRSMVFGGRCPSENKENKREARGANCERRERGEGVFLFLFFPFDLPPSSMTSRRPWPLELTSSFSFPFDIYLDCERTKRERQ